jgi:phosphoribosylglycinamide formyltransferase 1
MSARRRVAVLASGAGSNLAALIEATRRPGYPADIVLVISNRRDCGALAIATRNAVPSVSLAVGDFGNDSGVRDRAMLAALREARVELVVCAGYNRVLSDDVLSAYPNAILNVHPSLLPAFGGGMTAVEDALAAGVRLSGCTVHLLAAGAVDGGPIVLQAAVAVDDADDAESLRRRIHEQEWRLLPEAVELWATGRLHVADGRVRISPAAHPVGKGR